MAIAKKLGDSYEAVRASARIKTITVKINDAEFQLKVRVPVKRELDEITNLVANPNAELVNRLYEKLAAPLLATVGKEEDPDFLKAINSEGEKLRLTDNDVFVNGTSVRQIATMSAMWQTQVEKFFALLHTPTGEPVTETYDEIADEFPEPAIREIVNQIDKAIRPDYQETKKN